MYSFGETFSFQKNLDTIIKFIEHLSNILKSMPHIETTTVKATATPTNGDSTEIRASLDKEKSKTRHKGEDTSKTGKEDGRTGSQLQEKLRSNLNQIKDSLTLLQKFEESELATRLQTQLRILNDLLESGDEEPTPSTKAPSFILRGINKELTKLKYQIPSLHKLSGTSSRVHSQTSSGSNAGSSFLESLKPHESTSFCGSSFYKEINDIFEHFDEKRKFLLSCFAVLTEHAVVKRRLLTYWGLREGHLTEPESTNGETKTPEEIVDGILAEFKEKGLIEPAMQKRKREIRSYKMDPLVRYAVTMMNNAPAHKAFLVKGEEKLNLDHEKLVTLFNVNELSPDAKLIHLAKKKSKDLNVVDWLSKMKSLKVLYLGRWQKSARYHIEVKSTEFLKGLKSMEKLKFLSLQGISRINKLPPFIGMLKNLVVLDLKDCYNLEELSGDISSLTKLRYFDISNCYLLGNMPKELSLLTELQVLKGFVIGGSQGGNLGTLEDLKELKKLKKLTIIATRKDFPTPTDLGALEELKALQKLTIAWGVQNETSLRGKAAGSSVRPRYKLISWRNWIFSVSPILHRRG